eukprot:TRINITY_DN13727_c0_g1_i1.p1 TRINITY_DN13727_c0_g1~~TRINITY_DN13727_c0_g1_i1.p1  ORF type:complete len:172 (+),score=13.34 TRINITY_DN13727_c0_g1_i1:131-646(+)
MITKVAHILANGTLDVKDRKRRVEAFCFLSVLFRSSLAMLQEKLNSLAQLLVSEQVKSLATNICSLVPDMSTANQRIKEIANSCATDSKKVQAILSNNKQSTISNKQALGLLMRTIGEKSDNELMNSFFPSEHHLIGLDDAIDFFIKSMEKRVNAEVVSVAEEGSKCCILF